VRAWSLWKTIVPIVVTVLGMEMLESESIRAKVLKGAERERERERERESKRERERADDAKV
jgi:heme exporter protein D